MSSASFSELHLRHDVAIAKEMARVLVAGFDELPEEIRDDLIVKHYEAMAEAKKRIGDFWEFFGINIY